MAIKTVKVNIDNIDDKYGLDSVKKALINIKGVTRVDVYANKHVCVISFDDTQTSVHAFNTAINMVDYVTQPFPEDAPQNPDN